MRSAFDDLLDNLKAELGMRPPARAAWTAFAIIVILILALALALHFIARVAIPQAHAQPAGGTRLAQEGARMLLEQAAPRAQLVQDVPRVIFDCQQLGTYARRIAMLRDLGAQRDKVLDQLRRELRPGMMLAVLEREAKRVYAEKPSGPEAEASAYKRCQTQLGDMGEEG